MKDALFSVDLQAAMAKLAKGRLRNRHQVPLALVRRLAALGPESIAVRLGRRKLELEQLGPPLPARTLHRLQRLLDASVPTPLRLAELDEVEQADELDLLTAFVEGARRVELDAGLPTGLCLSVERGRCRLKRSSRISGTALRMSGWSGLHAKAAGRELREHLAWAPYEVVVNGCRISGGLRLADGVHQMALEKPPWRAVLGLPRQGRAQRIIRLRHGVLEEETWYRARAGMIYDMVCDGPGLTDEEALRWAQDRLPDLVAEARAAYDSLVPEARLDLVRVLLRMVDEGGDASHLLGELPLFPQLKGPPLKLEELPGAANGRVIRAVEPGARPGDYCLDTGAILVLDSLRRDFIQGHTDLQVRSPMRKPGPSRSLGLALREGLEGLRSFGRRFFAGSAVAPSDLREDEAALAAALEDFYARGWSGRGRVRVSFVRGTWSAHRWRDEQTLHLSRRHPETRRLLDAWRRKPESLYAIALLVEEGSDVFGPRRSEAAVRILGLDWTEKK